MFSFQINNSSIGPNPPAGYTPQGAADGFAFLIHTWGTGAIGGYGGNMGYARDVPLSDGIPYSLAVEFDTYKNTTLNDADGNHISIHNDGQYYNTANENETAIRAKVSVIPDFNDGAVHTARIEYDGGTKLMKVFVDDFSTPKVSATVNFDNIFLDGVEKATIGFTAGAALESSNHEILSWSYSPTFPAVEYAGNAVDVTAPNGSNPTTVALSPEYHPGADASHFNPSAKIDTAVLPDRATEIWAKYYFPGNIKSAGNLPLVLLLHGNHGSCGVLSATPSGYPRYDNGVDYTTSGNCLAGSVVSPSHRGYDYLAEKLASWGYIVASINANRGITPSNVYPLVPVPDFSEYPTDDNTLIWARGRLVLRHLQRLSEWNEGTTQFISEPPVLGTVKNNFTGWLGMKITTGSVPITVKSLGRLYRKTNSQTHTVKIVRESGNVDVASVSIPMTEWNQGQFKYANLASPVTLAANTVYYIVSQETAGGDSWSDLNTTLVPTSVATINGKVSSPNSTTWDTGAVVNQSYGTVDFIYEAAPSIITSTTLGTPRKNLSKWMGMKITTGASAVTVKSLGRMFKTGNTQTHRVRIVKVSDNSTIAEASVPMTGGVNGQYKYVNLTAPVTLAANTAYYVASEEANNLDEWYDSNTTVTPSTVAAVNGRVAGIMDGTTIIWNNAGAAVNKSYGPVNFIYGTSSAFITAQTLGTPTTGLTDWVGMKITTGAEAVTVSSLGRIFKTGNNQTHKIRIVRVSDGVTIGEVSVPMTGGINGQFKYVNLASPVTLAPNTAYYIASEEAGNIDDWYNSDTTVSANSLVAVNGRVSGFKIGTAITWNPQGGVANKVYGPVNFIYQAGSTPSALGVNLKGKIDFSNVGLMGHSRGGEAVRATKYLYETYNLPWTPAAETTNPWRGTYGRIRMPMTIKGIFEIAPVDGFVSTVLNTPNTPRAVILPACDGDVNRLLGVRPFDRMYVTPNETTDFPKSTFYVYGANHNFFNTQWQYSEVKAKCTAGEGNIPLFESPNPPSDMSTITGNGYGSTKQQTTALASFISFFRANVGSSSILTLNQTFDPLYNLPSTVSSVTKIERGFTPSLDATKALVFNNLTFANADLDKDLCGTATTTPAKNTVCSSNSSTTMQASIKTVQKGPFAAPNEQNHDPIIRTASVTWYSASAPSHYFQVNAANGTFVDASTFQTLDFRISRRRSDTISQLLLPNSLNPTGTDNFTKISVQLVMNNGSISAPISLSKYIRLIGPVGVDNVAPYNDGELHPILQTVRIPVSAFTGATLTQVKGVRFLFNDNRTGAIFLSGLRFLK